ncbi:MAG: sigma-70 family RNA polymerase sigma factor [Caldilineaceae bacterium]|nr:sigma-70 family RNA polymerase sigma factor [Caldilineaceae bacterium]
MSTRTSQLSDSELVQRVIKGEQSALMDLYSRYGKAVYSMAMTVLGQPHQAEEVTQDIFLKVWHRAEQWDERKGQFVHWLLAVTRNAAIDRARKEARRTPKAQVPLDVIGEALGRPAHVSDPNWENGHLLRTLLEQIPTEQKEVLELVYYQGLTHSELAEHLKLPLGTVKTRVRLGMEKLRVLWHEAVDPAR